MNYTVALASPEDAEAIAKVHLESLHTSHREHLPKSSHSLVLDESSLEHRIRGWRGWLKRSRTKTIVARDGDAVVGFCALQPLPAIADDRPMEVNAFFVHSSHWRRGVGRAIWDRVLEEARAANDTSLMLWVLETNAMALSFYESIGFRADGDSRVFFEHPTESVRELRYRRSI